MRTSPSQAELETFRLLLTRDVGFRLEDDKLPFLAELLAARMLQTRLATRAYLEHLAKAPSELAEIARSLTVTETYFLRNRDQFRAFEAIVRAREASGVRHLRILSAGSSSGEEAYSLAITLRKTLASLDGWTLSILGIDLNPDAVDKARLASYPAWSLRELPDDLNKEFFRKEGSRFMLSESIRKMARFEVCNLLHPNRELWKPESYDVVFCRNVLMYFQPNAARTVVANIAGSLSPDGYLFMGHAENLRGLSQDFNLRHSHNTFYYQHRSASEAHSNARHTSPSSAADAGMRATGNDPTWVEEIARASGRIQNLSLGTEAAAASSSGAPSRVSRPEAASAAPNDLEPVMHLLEQERFQEALRLLTRNPGVPANPDELLLRSMLLVSTGELPLAEQLCTELLAMDELNAGAHYIMAMCREHAGDRAGAIERSQAAAHLDADFAMPHLQLGRLARRMGQRDSARRELALALGLLAREDAARITLFGGGFDRAFLIALCQSELDACEAMP